MKRKWIAILFGLGMSLNSDAAEHAAGDLDSSLDVAPGAGEAVHASEFSEENHSILGGRLYMNYFGLFYGPSVQNPTSYQPSGNAEPDYNNPVLLKNFFGVGYYVADSIHVSGNAYWTWQPVLDHETQMMDPFLKIAHNSIVREGNFNLYGDVRFHIPASMTSRQNDLKGGIQTVQAATYSLGQTGFQLGLVGSARANSFGGSGFGNDMELYLAPNLYFQVLRNLSVTVMYEMNSSHAFGEKAFSFYNGGSDFEPGVSWDITQQVTLNPYLHIPVGTQPLPTSTSFGMMFNWLLV